MNKLRIRQIGVLSVAKMQALMLFVLMLLVSVPYGLFIIIFALSGASSLRGNQSLAVGGGGIVFGIFIMIGLPLIYSAFGFVVGALSALVYNIFAKMIGGIEIEVENVI